MFKKNHFFKMFRMSLFSLLCICGAINFRVTAISVSEFNTLVQHPGWRKLTTHRYANEFIFEGLNFEDTYKNFTLSEIFPRDSNTNLITEQNFVDRVWQFHLLLSVHYAIDLQSLTNLTKDFWFHCKNNYKDDLQIKCLDIFNEKFKIFYTELEKMQNSLLYFRKMVNLPMHNIDWTLNSNGILGTIYTLRDIGLKKHLPTDEVFENIIKNVRIKIENYFFSHIGNLNFPVNELDHDIFCNWYKNITIAQQDNDKPIHERYHTSIMNLIESNNSFGFQYDPNTLAITLNLTENCRQSFGRLSL
ncbi:uncharacterized protein LOC126905864 isoform X1 [Daktulosphaira vitifoliae]|uniref:uncharacterized protein LOC126905864 isoform X1 n=1 Tax=Daktulosphaira vitifoliae TaxID=58002 RepID=UPI0021A988B1|nr:uncharacterized protein LOC126905864 isoform X1 [Daktulosphaira vitifoliae]